MSIDHRPLSPRWCKHLLGCQRKGKEAYENGESRDSCPYVVHNTYHTGPANLLRQRSSYWLYGWDLASKASSND